MPRHPFNGRGHRPHKPVRLAPPESEPQLIFNGGQEEDPPEVAAFRDLLAGDAKGLKHALDAKRGQSSTEPAEYDVAMYAAIINGLVTSPYWQGRPPRLWVDQTTADRSFASPAAKHFAKTMGQATEGSEAHLAAQQELRVLMLAELATRAVTAHARDQGIIFQAPEQRAS